MALTGLAGADVCPSAGAELMTSPFSAAESSSWAAFFAFLFRENMQPRIGRRTSMTMTPPAAMPAHTPICSLTIVLLMRLTPIGRPDMAAW